MTEMQKIIAFTGVLIIVTGMPILIFCMSFNVQLMAPQEIVQPLEYSRPEQNEASLERGKTNEPTS